MSKNLLEDMVIAKHNRKETEEKEKQILQEKIWENGKNGLSTPKTPRYYLWFVAFFSMAFCFFALSFLFSKAEIRVEPKIKELSLNENLSANKDSNTDGLSFDLVVISGEENKNIQANGEKDVSEKAAGVVVIYNAFSSSPQGLDIDTRLEGSNGKIYKTQTKTTVPGMTKAGVPGSVEVKIYGSGAGVEYNSTPLDFKIFGFKGTPKYAKFYARSKGEITGGFVGKVPDISDADKTSAIADLKNTLEMKLSKKAIAQIPSGFILFKDGIFINTDNANNEPNISSVYNKDNSVTLTLKGVLDGILFNEQKLTKKIAEDNIDKYDGSDVYIPNIQNLTFALTNKDNISLNDAQNINFNLSGPAKIVSRLDVNKFTADLLGKSKKDFNQILTQYPNIDSATLNLSPFWKMSIPDKTKNIKVIVNYPK